MVEEKILVTGGTGYIGSHTVVELIKAGYEVVIIDNLHNSKLDVLDRIEKISGVRPEFAEVDLRDAEALTNVFEQHNFSAVLHFAGLKAVAESIEKPLEYYENNVSGTLNLLGCMKEYGVEKLIFSSSATVYGDQPAPLDESLPTGIGITNPYGRTKYMIEEIIKDFCVANPEFAATILRYFNPVGAHSSGLIGENPNDKPNNLMPIIMKVATGESPELSIYGDDYETIDGTCVRDFIHVVDLARGHLAALKHMQTGWAVYNLGSGKGTSVLEMVTAFEKASGKKLPYKITERRAGDLAVVYANPEKAADELGWQTELSISDMMRDTLNYLKRQQNG